MREMFYCLYFDRSCLRCIEKQSSETPGMSRVCVILLDGATPRILSMLHWGHKDLETRQTLRQWASGKSVAWGSVT